MATAPKWKVYDSSGAYQAACKEIEAAAILATWYGDGATIRSGHAQIVWVEGQDGEASDSFDHTARVCGA